MTRGGLKLFPRLPSRGLIEASKYPNGGCALLTRFRDYPVAASLKQFGSSFQSGDSRGFRDYPVAASLKRSVGPVGLGRRGCFRDYPVAASLKPGVISITAFGSPCF